MMKQHARAVSRGLKLLDATLLLLAVPVAYVIRSLPVLEGRFTPLYPLPHYWPMALLGIGAWQIGAWMFQVYSAYRTRTIATELQRIAQAMAVTALALAASGFFFKQTEVSRLFFLITCTSGLLSIALSRLILRQIAHAVRRRGFNTRGIGVVGSGELARATVARILEHREWGLTFAGYILEEGATAADVSGPVLGPLEDLGAILESHVLDEIVFAVSKEHLEKIESAVLQCEEQGVPTRVCLNFFPNRIARMELEDIAGIPSLAFRSTPSDAAGLFSKRAFDVVVSSLCLTLMVPLFLVVALVIKLSSRGPIFFRQRRVGLNGREFTLYKFRSMRLGAEAQLSALQHRNEMEGPVFKMSNDPRVTAVGRWLRRTSVDELPQFWNVLKGEMSIVGPRPPLPAEVKVYERWQRRRLSMKPGITCVWQVSGRSNVDFDRWVELDLHYIDNWSLSRDLKIFLKTIPAVLIGRGAR